MNRLLLFVLTGIVALGVMHCQKGEDPKVKPDYGKLIIGVWNKVGTNCDSSGEKCKFAKSSPIEYTADGNIKFGRIAQPYAVEGDVLYVGKKRSVYRIVKLDEKIFVWHAKVRNKTERFERKQ